MAIRNIRLEQGEDIATHSLYVDGVSIGDCTERIDFSVSAMECPHVMIYLNGRFDFSGKANVKFDADKILSFMSEKDLDDMVKRWKELHTEGV